jgi:FHS family L-fucose permease-like MFS transporter
MAFTAPPSPSSAVKTTGSEDNRYTYYPMALTVITTVFFMWGFLTCLNDILIPHLKAVFELSYAQVMLVQFTFFGAYFLMSLPAGRVVAHLGYKKSIVTGLIIAGIGAVGFWPAAGLRLYPAFLGALFVLATGITVLQVAANPYVALLGPERTSSSRLTLAQALNSLGTTIAPWFGSLLILSTKVKSAGEIAALSASQQTLYRAQEAQSVQKPYIGLAGVLGIFFYVGAEVSIGSFMVNYLAQPSIGHMSDQQAAHYVSLYWGGAMVGRFLGSALLAKFSPRKLLAIFASVNIVLLLTTITTSGDTAMYSIVAIGLFNSIMFPTIFSLGIERMGPLTGKASSLLIMAIVGGAVLPFLQGFLADNIGIQHAFFLPLLCYAYIVFYGMRGSYIRTAPVDAQQ